MAISETTQLIETQLEEGHALAELLTRLVEQRSGEMLGGRAFVDESSLLLSNQE